jgi:hypothetical protein
MSLVRRAWLPFVTLLLGLLFLVIGYRGSDEVTCGAQVMTPRDSCVVTVNGSSKTLSYDEKRARDASNGSFFRIAGWVVTPLSALALVVLLATRRGPRARGITAAQRQQLAPSRAELARQRGWELREAEPAVLTGATTGVLVDGEQRSARNVVLGTIRGWRFAIVDYVRKTYAFPEDGLRGTTVWVVFLPAPVPAFIAVDKPPHAERKQYRPLPNGDPAFERGYVVRTDAPDAVRQILTPEVTAVLREHGIVNLVGDGTMLVSHHPAFWSSNKAEALLVADAEALVALAERIPANVWLADRADGAS